MRMARTAVIAGATGLVGGELLRLLLESEAYTEVIAAGRRSTGTTHAKLQGVVWEQDRPEAALEGRLKGADLFIATGTTIRKAGSQAAFREVDYELPLRLARSAAAEGAASLVIVSSIGASASSRAFYLRVKGELEQELGKLGLRKLVLLRPSQILGARAEKRTLEAAAGAVGKAFGPLMKGPLARYRPVEARVIAAAMLAAAQHAPEGKTVLESEALPAEARKLQQRS
ncbi:Nucleoside-diphosphate-sugar epimerase [Paenibacillus pasadenensis]|uniref:Nucleoside-diphosphate-sugar epimerase n=2 Tax=Paenibacillus TaxID=44249 RepID=A0A2N5N6Q1_9BACL|nr:Nucleoside-diphosphate-sugar epimerase [Paenibacillus pasadenensis]